MAIAKFGETVSFLYLSNTGSAVTSQPVLIMSPAGTPRPLLATERFFLDSVVANVPAAVGAVDMTNASVAAGNLSTANLVLSLSATAPEFHDDGEGLAFPVGVTPQILLSSSASTLVRIGGVGRIQLYVVNGRQSWQAPLTPGTTAGGCN